MSQFTIDHNVYCHYCETIIGDDWEANDRYAFSDGHNSYCMDCVNNDPELSELYEKEVLHE